MQDTILNKKRRLNHLYRIVNKEGNVVKFKPNLAQQKVRDKQIELTKKKGKVRLLILKGRQLGITSYKLMDGLDDAMFKSNQMIVITAHRQDKQLEMFQKVKFAFESIPAEIRDPKVPDGVRRKPKPKYDSKTEYYFEENNSFIKVALDSRSGTPSGLHITELAFRDDAEAMMTGTLPSVPKNAPITIETTANGVGGYFYNMWNRYFNKENGEFECIFLPRYTDDDYVLEEHKDVPTELIHLYGIKRLDTGEGLSKQQINWYVNEWDKLGQGNKVFQEFPSTPQEAFLSSGDPVFNLNIIKSLPVVPYNDDMFHDHLRIYSKTPTYALIGVDTSEGSQHGDYASVSARDYKTLDLLASFYAKYPPDALCDVIDYLFHIYKNGMIGIERNNTGLVTLKTAQEQIRGYKWVNNLYKMPVIDEITKKRTSKLGWLTSTKTRPYLIGDFEKAIRLGEITQIDEREKGEMYSFIYNEQRKPEANIGCHDDLIIADAICYQMRNEPLLGGYGNEKKKKRREFIDPVTLERRRG